MAIFPWIIKKGVARRLRRLEKVLRDPAGAQQQLLMDMVRKARETEWGQDHSYDSIRTVRDFQAAVPVSRYDDLAPLWYRAFNGDRDVVWPGHIEYFSMSSGTTEGVTKMLPLSSEAIRRNFRSGATLIGLCERQAGDGVMTGGNVLYFGGSTRLEDRGPCKVGYASGINSASIPRFARRRRLPAPDIADIDDWEERVEAICERHLDTPISAVAGQSSWVLALFYRLIETARHKRGSSVQTMADVWPDLRAVINFGAALDTYRPRFEEVIGRPVSFIDTYSSSEGGLNAVQSVQDDTSMQLEVDTTAFYEFVPADEIEKDRPTRLTLDQIEPDVDYALLLTTPSGIWAYDIGDIVRFTTLDPPKLQVVGRTHLTLNMFAEHVIVHEVEQAMSAACRALGAEVAEFTVGGHPPPPGEPCGWHMWLVEFEGDVPPLDRFTVELDRALARENFDYAAHRKDDLSMARPVVEPMHPGTFYRWAQQNDALGGQHKIPHIARSQEMLAELSEISGRLAGQ